MNSLLHRLARNGDIAWLSYYFAEFVSSQQDGNLDTLPAYSAALVSEANLAGHVCIEFDRLCNQHLFHSNRIESAELPLGPTAAEWRSSLQENPCVGGPGERNPLIIDGMRLYMNRFWLYEDFVARTIMAMLARPAIIDSNDVRSDFDALFAASGDIDEDQAEAVCSAASSAFSVISGGPGSGKTSTVIRILAVILAHKPDCRIALAAPTGKAAARMMDSIRQRIDQLGFDDDFKTALPQEAKTIHRLLGYRFGHFSYHPRHRLALDCIIIDEASMLDLKLTYQLLAALPAHAQLILLGDRDQLASVAAGNVLGDITGHGQDPDTSDRELAQATRLLRSSYRFADDSAIGQLATEVNLGHEVAALDLLKAGARGLRWFEAETENLHGDALRWLLDAYQPIFESDSPAKALQIYETTRLLCATNHGPFGIENLNRRVSESMRARNHLPVAELYKGLPIMITRNFQELGLFNGDTGILWLIEGELRACFRQLDGSIRDLAINRLPEFKPAWASTVHKSQGSEFDAVLLLLPADSQAEVLSRELLYTAITRARHRFLLHAPRKVAAQAIGRVTRRHSGLASKLGWRPAATGSA